MGGHVTEFNGQLVYTAADGNYFLQAQVLLLSLVRTQTTRTRLVVFGNGWSKKELARLEDLAAGNVTVEVHLVASSRSRPRTTFLRPSTCWPTQAGPCTSTRMLWSPKILVNCSACP